MPKKKLLIIALFLLTISLSAQNWVTNFEEAKETAIKKGINIVLVFQGSDWCGPCIKLDKKVWSSDAFQYLSKDHFVMFLADFPKRKSNKLPKEKQTQNNKLAEHYNVHGYFPLAVVLNPKGEVLGKMGYEKISPIEYFNKLKAFE